jgi:hypothetical protein
MLAALGPERELVAATAGIGLLGGARWQVTLGVQSHGQEYQATTPRCSGQSR